MNPVFLECWRYDLWFIAKESPLRKDILIEKKQYSIINAQFPINNSQGLGANAYVGF